MIRVAVQSQPIDLAAAIALVEVPGAGGIASFTGCVRADDGVAMLTLEHYPGMTEAALEGIARDAAARFDLLAATVIHRVGEMRPGERIVVVATAAEHRGAAIDGCTAIIDRLKTEAPFWKRETRGGDARWVEARAGDGAAAERWR